jgi:hypothetical protein
MPKQQICVCVCVCARVCVCGRARVQFMAGWMKVVCLAEGYKDDCSMWYKTTD